ncbi:MAG: hypothetical protein ACRYFR_11665, partial [Janthinobacterium lividum]
MVRSAKFLPLLLLAAAAQLACSRAREREDGAAYAPGPPARPAAAPAVNVAAVVGHSIDEVRRQLGPTRPLPTD